MTNNPNAAMAGQKIVAEQTLKASADGELLPFRFQVKPEKSGVLFYRLAGRGQR